MKKVFRSNQILLAALIVLASIVNSCKEEDEYNYNGIYPVIQKVTGSAIPMQGRHYEFAATIRGGSSYSWESALNAEVITYPGATGAWKTYVYFPDVITTADAPEIITVTETTQGGISSNPKTFTVDSVTPFAALPITGPALVNGGFSANYQVSPSASDKVFSTYTWEATAGTITPNATEPWKMQIAFTNDEVGDVVISLIEETTKGLTDTSTMDVSVLEYCALASMADLVGVWSGDDGFEGDFYDSEVVTSAATATGVTILGLNGGWILNSWGETVTEAANVFIKMNADGTAVIESQYLFTTDYSGAPYEYWIEGEGRWNNCGEFPTLTLDYSVYNKTDDYYLPSQYYDYETFTATLVMDGISAPVKSAALKVINKASVGDISLKTRKK